MNNQSVDFTAVSYFKGHAFELRPVDISPEIIIICIFLSVQFEVDTNGTCTMYVLLINITINMRLFVPMIL